MVNVDGSKRIWKQPEIKDIFEKCGAKKPDKATWGDVQYVFAMYYSDGFPKVFKCENELVKATLMYLDDPDAPEGVAFIRWKKMLYRSAGNRIPVAGLFHITFFLT